MHPRRFSPDAAPSQSPCTSGPGGALCFTGVNGRVLPLVVFCALFCAVLLCPDAHASTHRHAGRHPHHLHTAARLRHARRHGTTAVRAAAHQAQLDAAENESPQPVNTAGLSVPQIPLHPINLPPLRGSHESLVRQNQRADQEGLARIQDDSDILALLHHGLLVPLPVSSGLHSDPRLPANRRYCRPFTAHFLADISHAYYARFHTGLQINSAVRTVEYQRHLLRVNGNAAPADGDIASPHLTGATIDIAKKGLNNQQIEWMRNYLVPLESAGKLDVEEEFYQSCFHISVYQSYQQRNLAARWP